MTLLLTRTNAHKKKKELPKERPTNKRLSVLKIWLPLTSITNIQLKLVSRDIKMWSKPKPAAADTFRPLDKIPYLKVVHVSHDGNQLGHLPREGNLF